MMLLKNSFISFATFDIKGIQFYTLNKNQEINITHMNDINSPFSPISPKYFFFNVKEQQEEISILIEKINLYIITFITSADMNYNHSYLLPQLVLFLNVQNMTLYQQIYLFHLSMVIKPHFQEIKKTQEEVYKMK